MIEMKEILMGRAELANLSKDVQDNLNTLLERINKVRVAYGQPMTVTSGYRRPQDTPPNGAAKSKHLIGAAIDIKDDDAGTLWFWCMNHLDLLKTIGLWLENGCYTHNDKWGHWTHFQIVPPSSGHRIFIPSSDPNPNSKFWDGKYDTKFD
jgi:hypothetical protein